MLTTRLEDNSNLVDSQALEEDNSNIIRNCTLAELKELAKEKSIQGYSNMNKTELIEVLTND